MLPISYLSGIISNQGTSSGGGGGSMPTPPSTGFATFTLTAPTTGTYPFSIGHTFKQGDLPSGSTLTGLQCTVKNTWPDGSAKIAVVSGGTTLTSNTPKTIGCQIGSAPTGSNLTPTDLAALITSSIVFSTDTFGSATFTSTDILSPFLTWVSGPLMSSYIYRKPIGSDAHLVAWMEVRHFTTGEVEVLPWVENGYTMVAGPTSKAGTYTFTLSGTQRFSGAIELRHHMRSPLINGTKLAHWFGSDRDLIVLHDRAYLMSTELVPTYRGALSAGNPVVAYQATSFTPLQQGGFRFAWTATNANTGYDADDMSTGGYGMPIGLLPTHDVAALTSHASDAAAAYRSVIWNGYSAGRYHTHYRDETTNYPLALGKYPTMVIAGSSGLKDTGSSSTSTFTPVISGGSYVLWDTAHCPSVGYMAYLLTGKRYFMEESQFSLIANHYNIADGLRAGGRWNGNGYAPILSGYTGADGICTTHVQLRSGAWHLRSLVQSLSITPNNDPLFTDLTTVMEKNCQWYNEVYIIGSSNPFGLVYDPLDYNTTGSYISGGVQAGSPWMQDFMTGVWGYAKALNLSISGTASSRMSAFYAWKAQNIVGKLGDSSGFWYVNAAVYAFANSPVSQPNYYSALGTTGPWYNSWKEIYDATYTNNTVTVNGLSNTEGVLGGEYFPENPPPSMWHNMQPAIAYAVRHGITGALTSYNRMVNASNWSSLLAGFSVNPVWGVMPSSGATSSATAFTLSCVTTGITGTPVTVTVTPDGPVPSTIVVTLAATNSGVLGTTTLSFTSGSSTAQSTTLTRSIDGASSLSITNNGGLSNAGTPITFTTTSSSSFPTWLSSASIGVWSQISSTSSPAEVGHFSGVALREELGIIEIFSGANGGHGGNLTNNRVLTLRLDLNTPTWVQRRAGSDATGWDTTGASGPYLPDGRPAPRHTYFDMFWSPERQRYLVGGRFWGSGAYDWGTTYDSFNPVTNDWDTAGTVSKTDSIMLSSRDPSTGILYNLNGYQYNPATNTLSTWNLTGSAALNRGSSAFDTTRNVMYHLSCGDNFGGPDSTLVSTKVTTGGVKTAITFNASSGWTSFQTDFPTTITAALTYDKDLDYYYYYMGNPAVGTQKIYRIKPNSTTVWDIDIMPVSGLTPASSFGGGVMNKFVYISSLGACVLVVGGQDVYFIRTSTPVPIQPTWLNSIAVNQWTTIPGTIMAGSPAAPGEDPLDYYFATGRTLAYSGMALREDTSELILAANGGHNDSSDNRVISIGINADSPAWQLRKAASLSGNRVIDAAYYLDGLPTSRHTYWSTQWIASRSRVMLPRTRFAYGNAVSFNNANGFNLTNNTWDAQGTWSDGSSVQCKDASDAMWAMSGTTLQKWTAATDTWSQTANFGGSAMPQGPMTYDSNRNQLFALAWGDGQAGGTGVTAYIFNSTGTTRTTITFNASSAYTQFQTDGPAYAALEYNPVTDKFYFYEGKSGITTRVYVVIPNGTTVWDMQILSVTGVTPPANYGGSGVMNRFRYVPALKGFVYLASGTDLLYFLKTS